MIYLDKYGWPVVTIKNRPVVNFIRRLIHTRKIVRHWEHKSVDDADQPCASINQIMKAKAVLDDKEVPDSIVGEYET